MPVAGAASPLSSGISAAASSAASERSERGRGCARSLDGVGVPWSPAIGEAAGALRLRSRGEAALRGARVLEGVDEAPGVLLLSS